MQDLNSINVGMPSINSVDYNSIMQQNKELLKEYYKREDTIRKETQKREDNAIQRQVKDMKQAGVDPNLVGVSGASSGGGISNATKQENILSTMAQTLSQENINNIKNTLDKYKFELEHNLDLSKEQREMIQGYIKVGTDGLNAVTKLIGTFI